METFDIGLCGRMGVSKEEIKMQYARMLEPLAHRLGCKSDGLTSMPFMRGKSYNGLRYNGEKVRILFVGRACNGWEIPFSGTLDEMVEQIFASAANMKDIKNGYTVDGSYNYNASPFFQLCRALMELYGCTEDWSDHIAWTNLYKVAPYSKGNPNNTLIRETLDSCASILRSEIEFLRPTHIVFITGSWWYKPIGKNLDENAFVNVTEVDLNGDDPVILGSGISPVSLYRPKVVITCRPEGAKLSRREHAQRIFDAFKAVDELNV